MSQFFSSLLWYFIYELRLITHGNSFKGKGIIFGYLSNVYSEKKFRENMINKREKENIALHRKWGKARERALIGCVRMGLSGIGTGSIDRGSYKCKRENFIGLGKENCTCAGYWFWKMIMDL